MQQLGATIANYWGDTRINASLKVFIALSCVVAPTWAWAQQDAIIPLVLGVIAAALSETDDNLKGKCLSFTLLFICATISSFTTQLLFNSPILFTLGFFFFSTSFIMLGAIGPRYASIAYSSILLSIYTMIGYVDSPSFFFQPVLLLIGLTWYALVALIWQWCWPLYPVQNSIARALKELSAYFRIKSDLFIPLPDIDLNQTRLNVAKQNAKLVARLEKTKITLIHHADKGDKEQYKRLLKTFFLIQDIHERGSSSHLSYEEMAKTFSRSDIMFRFQRILYLQAKECEMLAIAIGTGAPYTHNPRIDLAINEAQQSLIQIKKQNRDEWQAQIPHLEYLLQNTLKIESHLERLLTHDGHIKHESELADNEKVSPSEMWLRIKKQLNLKSPLFRHAMRLSLALCTGYVLIQTMDFENGYWIMLTSHFVCRASFRSTRSMLIQRIIGTIIGLIIGTITLTLFPDLQSQVIFMILAGVLFFIARKDNYSIATMAITLLVLFCFNQSGEGFSVILPRLGDTLIGCFIVVIVTLFFFPDWASLRQNEMTLEAIKSNQRYLAQVITQYKKGKHDDLKYRIARRDAHTKDAELSQLLTDIEQEPQRYKRDLPQGYKFLALNHRLLNLISALGAHRKKINNSQDLNTIKNMHNQIDTILEAIQKPQYQGSIDPVTSPIENKILNSESATILYQQLEMILRISQDLQAHTLEHNLT